jgi:3-oxoacyl-[acyl-carrier protein] reductase
MIKNQTTSINEGEASMKLQAKVAVVTGGGSGFGEGIAKLLAENGATVAVADINPDGANRVAAEIEAEGGRAYPVTVDVSRNDSMASLVETVLERSGQLDIFVNNAGVSHKNSPMTEVDEATFDRVYAVNVKSIYLSAIHVVPVFRRQGGGVFLNIASTAGVRPRPGLTWYNGTKGAVITITKSMAVELAPDKIRVNGINPVAGDTPLLAQFLPGEDTPETRQKFIDTIPLGRLSQPLDIARAALFLVSDEAEFITGVCLEVDGGRCI